jgi:serine/threonine protein kinase
MLVFESEPHQTLLLSEIDALNTLKNYPHILQLHDVQSDPRATYIITEFCEGG